jgi:DNA-binding CsgD family transcriptional regulator
VTVTESPVVGLTTRPTTGTNWQTAGLCLKDPELFFPEGGPAIEEAKKTCRACPVRAECLAYALDNNERFGIWGGLSERERRRLRKGQPMTDPVKARRDATVRRLTEEGFSAAEIAERVGCNERTVLRARAAVAA